MVLYVLEGKASFKLKIDFVSLKKLMRKNMLKKKKILSFGIETVLCSDLLPHSKKLVVRYTSSEGRRQGHQQKEKRLNCSAKAQTCSAK